MVLKQWVNIPKRGDILISNKDIAEQYNIFSNNIRYYRKRCSMTQERLAEKCDLSVSYIKQIESGREYKNVSLTVILKISKALNISVDKLFILSEVIR